LARSRLLDRLIKLGIDAAAQTRAVERFDRGTRSIGRQFQRRGASCEFIDPKIFSLGQIGFVACRLLPRVLAERQRGGQLDRLAAAQRAIDFGKFIHHHVDRPTIANDVVRREHEGV